MARKRRLKSSITNRGYISFTVKSLVFYFTVVIVLLSVGVFYATGKGAVQSLLTIAINRQANLSQATALSIETQVEQLERSLVLIATTSRFDDFETSDYADLNHYVTDWNSWGLDGVMAIDANGVGTYSYTYGNEPLFPNVDVSDRDYFKEALTAERGDVVIGSPIIPRKNLLGNKVTIPMATPLFDENNNIEGVLSIGITVDSLGEKVLEPLNSPHESRVYLLDDHGHFLYGVPDQDIGKPFNEIDDNSIFPRNEHMSKRVNEIINGCVNVTEAMMLSDTDDSSLTENIVSIIPISCSNGGELILIMVTPTTNIMSYLAPIYINEMAIIFVVMLIIVAYTVVHIKFAPK